MSALRNITIGIIDAYERLRSAAAVSAAVEAHRTPRAADLRRLGINPQDFLSIGHG